MIEEIVNREMEALGIPYQYWEFHDMGGGVPDCYYVGEKLEDPLSQEDGRESGTFVLSGWCKSPEALQVLVGFQEAVKARFKAPLRVRTAAGAAVVEYSGTTHVPSDADGVHRLETNLNYYEWSAV